MALTRREHDEGEVEHPLSVVQIGERRLECEREQEAGEDLRAGLQHPQLLQHLDPVAVGALGRALVATVGAVVARIGVAVRGHGPSLRSPGATGNLVASVRDPSESVLGFYL